MNMPSRRRFLAHSLLATSAVAGASLLGAPGRLWAAAGEPAPSPLLTRPIPSTGELLPVIGAGTSGSYDVDPGSAESAQWQLVVRHAFEGGGSGIATAPTCGRSDTVVGSLLADGGWRDRCFLATKIAADSAEDARAQWAESLRRLRTDHVELLQVHNMRDWQRQLPYARELKAQGRTKYV